MSYFLPETLTAYMYLRTLLEALFNLHRIAKPTVSFIRRFLY